MCLSTFVQIIIQTHLRMVEDMLNTVSNAFPKLSKPLKHLTETFHKPFKKLFKNLSKTFQTNRCKALTKLSKHATSFRNPLKTYQAPFTNLPNTLQKPCGKLSGRYKNCRNKLKSCQSRSKTFPKRFKTV